MQFSCLAGAKIKKWTDYWSMALMQTSHQRKHPSDLRITVTHCCLGFDIGVQNVLYKIDTQ